MYKQLLLFASVSMLICILACNDDDTSPLDNNQKVITDVDLVFNPVVGGIPLSFSASDPDGEGPEGLETDPVVLKAGNSYQLFIKIRNDIDNIDLTNAIEEEGAEHMFFFGFTDALFGQPEGDGNIDNRSDQVNYIDEDENGLSVGLITGWQTGEPGTGTFRVVLKHQPEMKTAISGIEVGRTDLDLTFQVTIEE